jgi:MEDS: MEthanogen/methylotroph, DcmR Sensory domain
MVIHRDEDSVTSVAAQVLAAAIQFGQPALLITAGGHLDDVRNKLAREGINTDELIAAGRLTAMNADTLLDVLMVGDAPDPIRFRQMIGALLEQLCSQRDGCIPVIYSDMADRLWKRGNKAAALSLEILWNRLATAFNFSLMCGYSGHPSTPGAPTLEELREVCDQHNHIIETRPN